MRRLHDASLATKLWGLLITVLIAMAAASGIALEAARRQQTETTQALRRADDIITLVTQWRAISQRNTEQTLASNLIQDDALAKFFGQRLKNGIAESSELQKRIVELATSERDRAQSDVIGERRKAVLGHVKAAAALRQQADWAGLQALFDRQFMPALAAYDQAQADMVTLQQQQRDELLERAARSQRNMQWASLGATLAVLGAALSAAAWLLRSITVPLAQAVAAAEAIAAGDLRQDLASRRHDEIGRLVQSVGAMSARLRQVVTEVRDGVQSVEVASTQIASGNQDLSARTEQTASNLQQTASSLEQVAGTIRRSADNAAQANQLAASAQDSAVRGGHAVADVVGRMEEISTSSRKIGDITAVIDGISFQTNILALNAAVEAARAGEQGRGFAVVAAEVRALAQRSSAAAREIRTLITQSTETVAAGVQEVNTAKDVIDEVVGGVRKVAVLMDELSRTTAQQRDTIDQVNQAVGHIDQMTQQNAALVEEAAAAASSLHDQSQALTRTVSMFRTAA